MSYKRYYICDSDVVDNSTHDVMEETGYDPFDPRDEFLVTVTSPSAKRAPEKADFDANKPYQRNDNSVGETLAYLIDALEEHKDFINNEYAQRFLNTLATYITNSGKNIKNLSGNDAYWINLGILNDFGFNQFNGILANAALKAGYKYDKDNHKLFDPDGNDAPSIDMNTPTRRELTERDKNGHYIYKRGDVMSESDEYTYTKYKDAESPKWLKNNPIANAEEDLRITMKPLFENAKKTFLKYFNFNELTKDEVFNHLPNGEKTNDVEYGYHINKEGYNEIENNGFYFSIRHPEYKEFKDRKKSDGVWLNIHTREKFWLPIYKKITDKYGIPDGVNSSCYAHGVVKNDNDINELLDKALDGLYKIMDETLTFEIKRDDKYRQIYKDAVAPEWMKNNKELDAQNEIRKLTYPIFDKIKKEFKATLTFDKIANNSFFNHYDSAYIDKIAPNFNTTNTGINITFNKYKFKDADHEYNTHKDGFYMNIIPNQEVFNKPIIEVCDKFNVYNESITFGISQYVIKNDADITKAIDQFCEHIFNRIDEVVEHRVKYPHR